MSFLRQTSVSYLDAKQRIAESTGSASNTSLQTKAGNSLRAAVRYWNNRADWKWLRTTTSFSTVVGQDTYALPALLKSIHSVHVTSSQGRALSYIDRRTFNKAVPIQTIPNMPFWYDLFGSESSAGGVIRLFPIPTAVETVSVDYFRRMVLPCSVSTTGNVNTASLVVATSAGGVDGVTIGSNISAPTVLVSGQTVAGITDRSNLTLSALPDGIDAAAPLTIGGDNVFLDTPEEYTEGIIAWGTFHYLMNMAGSPRLDFWRSMAQEELDKAITSNRDGQDAEQQFMPSSAYDAIFLGPNDIRWADYWP